MKKECKMHRKAEAESNITDKTHKKWPELFDADKNVRFSLIVSKCCQFRISPKFVKQHKKDKKKMKDNEQNSQQLKLP